jgi:predicted hotdog family 3-hydroxylacyl-ACP dehydratase
MIEIEALIPHREPIKVIQDVIELQEHSATTTAVVDERWPLYDGRGVGALALIEAIAQTSAIVEGYKRKKEGKGGVKGWLVGIKSAEFSTDTIEVNTPITVHVDSLHSLDNYGVMEGVVTAKGRVLLKAVLQAIRLDQDP